MNHDIPQQWIKSYVDKLLDIAKSLDTNSVMHVAVLSRADAIMDMVKAFRESKEGSIVQ